MVIRRLFAIATFHSLFICNGQEPRMVLSQSGPSGVVSGSRFIFDETRNRFVYPRDASLTVYFEWKYAPGRHVMSALWKDPGGRVSSISPDVKLDAPGDQLSCYWIYNLVPGIRNGIWTVEVKVDGKPAGSHSFEIAGMEEPKPAAVTPPQTSAAAPKRPPTLDDLFRGIPPSLVSIHKLDRAGRKFDTATGFVIGQDRIATAFQAIDCAAGLEIEFADGQKAAADRLASWSRLGDWAVIAVPTRGIHALEQGDAKAVAVGERLIVFNVESSFRTIGGVDIAGKAEVPGFGSRIRIDPHVTPEAAGGPLLDSFGRVVGVLGGAIHPGARYGGTYSNVSPALWQELSNANGVTPVAEVKADVGNDSKSLQELESEGVLTPPVERMEEFKFGGTTAGLPKTQSGSLPSDTSEFTARDSQIFVYSVWTRVGKTGKGEVSAQVYDAANRLRVKVAPRKLGLSEVPMRVAAGLSPLALGPGVYRVDVLWDGRPAWRTYFRLTK